MAKFYGPIGYAERVEKTPGVWVDKITERNYYGDVLQNSKSSNNGENLNDEININNRISIVADAYANQHFFAIRYVKWMGSSWKITKVDVQAPRLILTIGGIYNG